MNEHSLTNQFVNVNNLKFGNTWANIYRLELQMASITEDAIVLLEYIPSLQELSAAQINA